MTKEELQNKIQEIADEAKARQKPNRSPLMTAMVISCAKWRRWPDDIFEDSCALCQYTKQTNLNRDVDCTKCPVYWRTEKTDCENSPWENCYQVYRAYFHTADEEKAAKEKARKAEYKFLRKIWRDVKSGALREPGVWHPKDYKP